MLFPLEKVRKGFSDLIFFTLGRIVLARTCSHAPVVVATTAGIFGDEAKTTHQGKMYLHNAQEAL